MDNNGWIQIKATAKREWLEDITAVMNMIATSLMTEDYSDIEQDLDGVYGDLIDEELLARDRTTVSVSAFIPVMKNPAESELFVKQRFDALGIPATVTHLGVSEEDWADSWKQYYKPIKTGDRLVIVPVWEKYDKADGEVTVLMDPGMAFGTGTHETTRLCAALLEKHLKPGDRMLDVGCGSGILAICAAKLGASECFACDIDPVAVRIAGENAALNSTPNVEMGVSDLLKQVKRADGGYEICTANIVADIIIRLAPDIGEFMAKDSKLIVSGIIEERADEVLDALAENGFTLVEKIFENGWCAAVVTPAQAD